ncbi:MAG TPA: S1 RNA-binding domain-containing protein [Acidimicrobiales bacterium]|nr:S1 RNA-binding domain-containing protein [Acidimicrobiales bacterium]
MAPPTPAGRRVVVDGSNLATEGRSTPSLAQLDEAVRAFAEERPGDEIIVVVDASFGYRIDESERKMFEEAEDAGEIVSPPAGAIGRGDGFLLRIADRINADVLSNDSFQEFHGEYTWLFDEGRLVGGKPVPGVGWIFTPRTPVRGPKSRVATRDADRARKRSAASSAAAAARVEPTAEAIAEATAEAIAPDAPKTATRGSRRRSRSGSVVASAPAAESSGAPEAVNEPLPFITFIAEHPLGTEVEGTVDSFTSHGAFVTADGARCYAPVSGLGDPPPRSAKEVLKRGETRSFVIQALDPPRRGIELALPGLAKVAGAPTDETVEAEIDAGSHPAPVPVAAEPEPEAAPTKPRRSRLRAAPKAEPVAAAEPEPVPVTEPEPEPAKPARRSRKKAVAAPVEPAPEAPVAPVRKARKKAAPEPVVEEPVKKATRARKKAAPEPEPVAVAEEPPPEPVKKRATRKKAAAEPVVEPVKKARKSTKKAAAPAE